MTTLLAILKGFLAATALAGLMIIATAIAYAAEPIVGQAVVTDGDTIRIGANRIRIFGIDAPERKQTCDGTNGRKVACGAAATKMLETIVSGRTLTCTVEATDRYRRSVATCLTERGEDIGKAMVEAGAATAYRKYSTRYVEAEDRAKASGFGLWGLTFQDPADVRRPKTQ